VSGQVARAGLAYFALVFGAGFVLGPLRILFLVPRVGGRAAELLDLPVVDARAATRRGAVSRSIMRTWQRPD